MTAAFPVPPQRASAPGAPVRPALTFVASVLREVVSSPAEPQGGGAHRVSLPEYIAPVPDGSPDDHAVRQAPWRLCGWGEEAARGGRAALDRGPDRREGRRNRASAPGGIGGRDRCPAAPKAPAPWGGREAQCRVGARDPQTRPAHSQPGSEAALGPAQTFVGDGAGVLWMTEE